MKRKITLLSKLILLCFITVSLNSCGKDSSIGPEGQNGDKGKEGEQGVKGLDGTTIHSGKEIPKLTIGKQGDYYLNLTTTELYGPKTETTWGNPISLKGNEGSKGEDGSKIHSDKGLPKPALGTNGDFYFDKEGISIYGPKTDLGWGTPLSLGTSGNNNGVKIIIIPNHKFEGKLEYYSNEKYQFKFNSHITPTTDYSNYYENGAALIYFKSPQDINGN